MYKIETSKSAKHLQMRSKKKLVSSDMEVRTAYSWAPTITAVA